VVLGGLLGAAAASGAALRRPPAARRRLLRTRARQRTLSVRAAVGRRGPGRPAGTPKDRRRSRAEPGVGRLRVGVQPVAVPDLRRPAAVDRGPGGARVLSAADEPRGR